MKRLAAVAFLFVAATAPRAGAGSLPSPISPLGPQRDANPTHYVRGDAHRKLPPPIRLDKGDKHRSLRVSHYVRGR